MLARAHLRVAGSRCRSSPGSSLLVFTQAVIADSFSSASGPQAGDVASQQSSGQPDDAQVQQGTPKSRRKSVVDLGASFALAVKEATRRNSDSDDGGVVGATLAVPSDASLGGDHDGCVGESTGGTGNVSDRRSVSPTPTSTARVAPTAPSAVWSHPPPGMLTGGDAPVVSDSSGAVAVVGGGGAGEVEESDDVTAEVMARRRRIAEALQRRLAAAENDGATLLPYSSACMSLHPLSSLLVLWHGVQVEL